MFNYAVSFSLEFNSNYDDRYRSLMDAIHQTPKGSPWTETTSFALVSTGETLAQFADRLYFQTMVNSATDILLVFDPSTSSAIARGPVKYPHTLGLKFQNFEKK